MSGIKNSIIELENFILKYENDLPSEDLSCLCRILGTMIASEEIINTYTKREP